MAEAVTGITFTCGGRKDDRHDPPVPVAYVTLRPPGSGQRGTMPAELRCPMCGTAKRLGYRVLRRLTDAGLAEVDITALPF